LSSNIFKAHFISYSTTAFVDYLPVNKIKMAHLLALPIVTSDLNNGGE